MVEEDDPMGLHLTPSEEEEIKQLHAQPQEPEDDEIVVDEEGGLSLSVRDWTLIVGIVLLAVIGYSQVPILLDVPLSHDLYSVVFDAGSTGSRVFVFQFKIREPGNAGFSGIRLEREVFQSVEPGISAYSRNPKEAAESLEPLLDRALQTVPKRRQEYTLVTFKATAGLRLLPKAKADAILFEVRKLLSGSKFYLPDPQKIEIMSGEEEGLFGWVSVNFLLDLLWDEKQANTVTTFDLGGGSIQVAFQIPAADNLGRFLVKDLFRVQLLHSEFHIFTKSYLGYGLKSARLGVLGGKESPDGKVVFDPDAADIIDMENVLLLSPCHSVGHNFTIIQGEITFIIKGSNEEADLLPLCQEKVDTFVAAANFIQDKELSRREIHLFSYFFDVARWSKMIPWNEHKHVLTPRDFLVAAEKYCLIENRSIKHPFLCQDLLYIHSLLTKGAGLPQDKLLNVETQILGREVSWSLGAALSTLSNQFSFSPLFL